MGVALWQLSPPLLKRIHCYGDEFAFRQNRRKLKDGGRTLFPYR